VSGTAVTPSAARASAATPPAARANAVFVGLMSGTSLDGISAAVVRFRETPSGITHELLASLSLPYSAEQRDRLAAALTGVPPHEYALLDFEVGAWLAAAAAAAIAEAGVARADIGAIASHGHTVWHDPPRASWQIGQAAVIAERTGVPVISDFRARDIAAGGQGAPLVPIADALLFAATDHWRALQNLGGIGNVTIVPPAEKGVELASVRAFDTGPGVILMDAVVRMRFRGKSFDEGGALARRGTAITSVVDALLEHPYFAAEPPKSTGRELFSGEYVDSFVSLCKVSSRKCSSADIVATAVSLTARSIALAFERFVPEPVAELVLSGGGARNPALFDAIERELSAVTASGAFQARRVVTFDDLYFDSEAKEAVAFAFLGWLHLQGRAGNVYTATGAKGPRILGTFTPA
jgi:anhydro-N-acetylmuramic acid kinase